MLHVTLLTAVEYKAIPHPLVQDISIPFNHIYVLGIASSAEHGRRIWCRVVVCNHADIWRHSGGLGKKEYYVALSEKDDHQMGKGVGSLLRGMRLNELIREVTRLGEDGMDQVIVAAKGEPQLQYELSYKLVTLFPTSYKGYIRLADTTSDPTVSALPLVQAVRLNPSLLTAVSSRLRKLHDTVSWGPFVTSAELDVIPSDLRPLLLRPWAVELDDTQLSANPTTSRERILYLGEYELPRFFSWIYPGRLAGMSTPRNEADIDVLAEMGLTHVLSRPRRLR